MFVRTELINNLQTPGGPVGQALSQVQWDPGLLRPYIDNKGRNCVTINTGRKDGRGNAVYQKRLISDFINNGMVLNGPTALRKLEWVELDRVILRATRERLRAWTDLSAACPYGGFDGMSKTMLEYESMSDPGEAFTDMDGLTEGRNDAPRFQLEGLPLPITHADFWFPARKLHASQNSGTPLDMTMPEAAARRVAERIERTLIGTITGMTYGQGGVGPLAYGRTPTAYGYTNFPQRTTYTSLTAPTAGGWAPKNTLEDVLALLQTAYNLNFFGPYMLYHSTDWDQYMDNDYILSGGNVATMTLRNRLRAIDVIQDVRRLDFLKSATNPFTLLLIQMTPDVCQAVNGMDITTVQWQSMGGMRLNFKVMCIQVPRIRADFYGRCGIIHATTS